MDAAAPLVLDLPFRGRWRVENSPANRVPSHGTHLLGTTHAIDFVPVDAGGRSAPTTVRSVLGHEPPERFVGFGLPILSPTTGTIVAVHDGEPDHAARRSLLSLVPYLLGQGARLRSGLNAIAGNYVVVEVSGGGAYVLLAHLRRRSLQVAVGDVVGPQHPLGECGNSGNSTEPHVHVQAVDTLDWHSARGLPIAFRQLDRPGSWMPRNGEVVTGVE